jgi:hypothetical protein
MTIMSPVTAASFLYHQRVEAVEEDAAEDFRDESPTTVGPAVDSDGLEDGLRSALCELTPVQRLQVLTSSGHERRRCMEMLVASGSLPGHHQERAELWLRATARPSPRYGVDQARARAINAELAHTFVAQKAVP